MPPVPTSFHVTRYGLAAGLFALGVQQVVRSIVERTFHAAWVYLFLTSVGLVLSRRWGRWLSLPILWLVVFSFVGTINPFAFMDQHITELTVPLIAFFVAQFGFIVLAIWALHVFGKYKSEFR